MTILLVQLCRLVIPLTLYSLHMIYRMSPKIYAVHVFQIFTRLLLVTIQNVIEQINFDCYITFLRKSSLSNGSISVMMLILNNHKIVSSIRFKLPIPTNTRKHG